MFWHSFIKLCFFYSLFFHIYSCLYVTDGSFIILENKGTKYKLFSTDMKWGSGSGNQLVTSIYTNKNQDNLLWGVSIYSENKSLTGSKIECNEIITLKHVKSDGYLVDSKHNSILSNNYEISVHKNNESRKFKVICQNNNKNSYWKIGETVFLKSATNDGYLSTSKKYEFNEYNCRNCPIINHLETCIMKQSYQKDEQKWIAKPGVIISHFEEDINEDDMNVEL